QMDLVRDVCAGVLSVREEKNLRTRLPLKTLTVAHPDVATLTPYRELIAEEINVKAVGFSADPAQTGERRLVVRPQIGKRSGPKMKDVMAAVGRAEWSELPDGRVAVAGIELGPEDFSLRVVTPEGLDSKPFDQGRGLVVLDTRVYQDLEREGFAR